MSIVNLSKNRGYVYEGDYIGNVPQQVALVRTQRPNLVEVYKDFRIYEMLPVGSAVPKYIGIDQFGNRTEMASTPADAKKTIDSQMPGNVPVVIQTSTPPGGGGTTGVAPIVAATAGAGIPNPGWHQIDTYKGWKILKLVSPLEQPKYRAVWGNEVTPVKSNPTLTYQDVDRTADRPRTTITRMTPDGSGLPDSVRSRAWDQGLMPAKLDDWKARLQTARNNWGPSGLVMTHQGIRIYRGFRNIKGPGGDKVTVPVFYTKQKMVGVPSEPGQKEDVLQGYLPMGGMGADTDSVGAPSTVEASGVAQMLDKLNQLSLAPGEAPAPESGPGPASETLKVDTLPGEGGSQPSVTFWSNPDTKTLATVGGWLVGLAALLMVGKAWKKES